MASKTEKIYIVTTEGDVEGRTTRTLGYVTGEIKDIQDYFEDRKAYDLSIRPLQVEHITPQMASGRQELIKRKKSLEEQLAAVKQAIK